MIEMTFFLLSFICRSLKKNLSLWIIGDHAYKQNTQLGHREQMISALPDIQQIELQPGDDFIVLACDGIWNSKTNQQVIDFVRPRLQKAGNSPKSLSKICEEVRYIILHYSQKY